MKEFSLRSCHSSVALVFAFSSIVLATACAESSDDDDGTGARAGASGSSGKGGSGGKAGSGGQSGSTGKGGNAGRGGSAGASNGGDAGDPGSGTAGEPGSAGDAGSAGREAGGAGGAAGETGASGEAGQGGEGNSPLIEGTTCKSILEELPSATTGLYLLDPDGDGGDDPVVTVCDMDTDGGGWTLGLLKNSMDNGSYGTFASARFNVAALAVTPEAAAASAPETPAYAGWIDLNAFPYTELALAGYRNGERVYRSEPIPKSELRIPFGQDGYYLYDQVDGYYWCGGTAAYTNEGVGQVDPPSGAPVDCKGHTSLGDGWDFGPASYNQGLTACGGGSALMTTGDDSGFVGYGTAGAAQAFWVR